MGFKMPRQWPDSASTSDNSGSEDRDVDPTNVSYEELDLLLNNEMIEEIERGPLTNEARKVLMQHYEACGWFPAAEKAASQVLKIDNADRDPQQFLNDSIKRSVYDNSRDGKGKEKMTAGQA